MTFNEDLRRAFLVYLISHNRPMAEVLAPMRADIAPEFERGFDGMTDTPIALDDLLRAREQMVEVVIGQMPAAHRQFLISVKRGEPSWELLAVPGAADLPAVRWKLENLAKLSDEKRLQLAGRLGGVLGVAELVGTREANSTANAVACEVSDGQSRCPHVHPQHSLLHGPGPGHRNRRGHLRGYRQGNPRDRLQGPAQGAGEGRDT